ncbi:MAG: hypothetical protein GX868_09300 [Actinobacteria bacterium]|nr:hypothetical protein [Actinomycetota bacterium]
MKTTTRASADTSTGERTAPPMRRRSRNAAFATLALSAVALVGCAPDPAAPASVPEGAVGCGGGSAILQASQGVTFDPAPVTYTLRNESSTSWCVDSTGTGVTSATIESLNLSFASLFCGDVSSRSGSGTLTIRWSDGSKTTAQATATLDSMFGARLTVVGNSGHFSGFAGTADLTLSPIEGSCYATGVTANAVTLGPIVLSPAH